MSRPVPTFPARLSRARTVFAIAAVMAAIAAPALSHAADLPLQIAAPGRLDATTLPRELQRQPQCTGHPMYPRQAYRRGLEGTTVVRVTVGTDGRIRVMTVFRSAGDTTMHREMDEAVTSMLATCSWEVVSPASFDRPVDLDVIYTWKKAEHEGDV